MQMLGKECVANTHPPILAQGASALWAFFVPKFGGPRISTPHPAGRVVVAPSLRNFRPRERVASPTQIGFVSRMYGMVNKAVEGMVCAQHGEQVWARIKARSGVDVEVFISNQSYPDDLTYRLVAAASAELGRPAEEILEAFGRHWVRHTAMEGYGALMEAAGDNLRDFLLHLPNFHTRVMMIYPKLQPPRFTCTDAGPGAIDLHYFTHREGLAPFVVGLVRGLAQHFNRTVEIEVRQRRTEGADHDVFRIHGV